MEHRIEHDSMGEVKVPAEKYWGAQTQRSHENFPIGVGIETMPREITHAFGILKQAAARANHALKPEKMTGAKCRVIEQAAAEVASGALDVRASDINDTMKLSAASAIAGLVSDGELSADYIPPKAFDPRVKDAVARATAEAARASGVARI